jgi:hypothetical protein
VSRVEMTPGIWVIFDVSLIAVLNIHGRPQHRKQMRLKSTMGHDPMMEKKEDDHG